MDDQTISPSTPNLIFGYSLFSGSTARSGLRVLEDGVVEVRNNNPGWESVTTLNSEEIEKLKQAVNEADLGSLPAELPAAANQNEGTNCEVWSNLNGKNIHAIVNGQDSSSAARVHTLVNKLSDIVGGIQSLQQENQA
jgi:hypothetical protein